MSGHRVVSAIDVLDRIAEGLTMPDQARMWLGLAPKEDPMKRRAALGVGIMTALSPQTLTSVLHDAAEEEAIEYAGKALTTGGWRGTVLPRAQALDAVLQQRYPKEPATRDFHEQYLQFAA
jgi:hypothetical protein